MGQFKSLVYSIRCNQRQLHSCPTIDKAYSTARSQKHLIHYPYAYTDTMARGTSSTADVLLYFLALFLPPVPVFIKRGCGADLLINIALDFLGWIPGVIHAWYIISKTEDRLYVDDRRRMQ